MDSLYLPPDMQDLLRRACKRAHRMGHRKGRKRGYEKGRAEGHASAREELINGLRTVVSLNGSGQKVLAATVPHEIEAADAINKARKEMMRGEHPEWLPVVQKSFDESKHPRGKNGQFIDHAEIAEAATDPAKRKELEAEVKPGDEKKLATAIADAGGAKDAAAPKLDASSTAHDAATGLEKLHAAYKKREIGGTDIGVKSEHQKQYQEAIQQAADHIGSLTRDELTKLKEAMQLKVGGKKAEIARAIAMRAIGSGTAFARQLLAPKTPATPVEAVPEPAAAPPALADLAAKDPVTMPQEEYDGWKAMIENARAEHAKQQTAPVAAEESEEDRIRRIVREKYPGDEAGNYTVSTVGIDSANDRRMKARNATSEAFGQGDAPISSPPTTPENHPGATGNSKPSSRKRSNYQREETLSDMAHSLAKKRASSSSAPIEPTPAVAPQAADDWKNQIEEKLKSGMTVYRGTGRGFSNDHGVAGKGEYHSGSKQAASAYGPNVTESTVKLNKPLIATYGDLDKLQTELYGKALTGFEPELSQKFDDYLRSKGYDGVALFDKEIGETEPQEVVKLAAGSPTPEKPFAPTDRKNAATVLVDAKSQGVTDPYLVMRAFQGKPVELFNHVRPEGAPGDGSRLGLSRQLITNPHGEASRKAVHDAVKEYLDKPAEVAPGASEDPLAKYYRETTQGTRRGSHKEEAKARAESEASRAASAPKKVHELTRSEHGTARGKAAAAANPGHPAAYSEGQLQGVTEHRKAVAEALANGEYVPPHVLKEYESGGIGYTPTDSERLYNEGKAMIAAREHADESDAGPHFVTGGNTYAHRAELQKLGGKWDANKRRWVVPATAVAKLPGGLKGMPV